MQVTAPSTCRTQTSSRTKCDICENHIRQHGQQDPDGMPWSSSGCWNATLELVELAWRVGPLLTDTGLTLITCILISHTCLLGYKCVSVLHTTTRHHPWHCWGSWHAWSRRSEACRCMTRSTVLLGVQLASTAPALAYRMALLGAWSLCT